MVLIKALSMCYFYVSTHTHEGSRVFVDSPKDKALAMYLERQTDCA